jgi:metallo-beta-lactamase class B
MRTLPLAALLAFQAAVPAAAREAGRETAVAAPEIAIRQLEPGAWVITQTRPFSANALLVEMGAEDLVLVDTLYTPAAMKELLAWIDKKLPKRRLLAINTHFHSDRTGGNAALKERKVPLYAADATVRLMKTRGRAVMEGVSHAIADEDAKAAFLSAPIVPADGVFALKSGLKLTLGGRSMEVVFPGPGHAPENLVVWFPERKLLFGGCLVLASSRVGNTSDSDLKQWAVSASALLKYDAERVVPGHGWATEPALISQTVQTLEAYGKKD